MKLWLRRTARIAPVAMLAAVALLSQTERPQPAPAAPPDVVLPNGKSQRDEILKAEHKKNLKDIEELIGIAEQLKQEMDKNDRYVLSLGAIKKTEEIEKLARNIRTRMRRF